MTKKRKKKRSFLRKRFYRIYLIVVALVLIGVFVSCIWLRGLLEDYEISHPSHIADKVEALFRNGSFDTIYSLDTSAEAISKGDRNFYTESFQTLLEGKDVVCIAGYSPDPEELRYHIYMGRQKLADFVLVPSGRKTGHNQTLWTLGSITTCVTLAEPEEEPPEELPEEDLPAEIPEEIVEEPPELFNCSITVPSDATVVVDDFTLDSRYIMETGIKQTGALLLPYGLSAPVYTRYGFVSVNKNPVLQVTDPEGNLLQPKPDGNLSWNCYPEENLELKAMTEKSIAGLSKVVAKFLSGDLKRARVLAYCAKSSPAYTTIQDYNNSWYTAHYSVAFQNMVISDYTMHSDNCFTCKVTFDFIMHCTNDKDRVYPTTYRFCFIRDGEDAKLYSLTLS